MRACLIAVVFSLTAVAANAGVLVQPPPGAARVANADAVVVGKVTSIEPQDVMVGTTKYRIAVVQIEDAIKGVKEGVKSVRIGFIPIEKPKPNVFVTGGRPVQLQVSQGGLFLLKKNSKEAFFEIGGIVGYYVNSDKNDEFAKELAAAKSAAKASVNPQASLKSKDADERLAAAAILVEKYRAYRGPKASQEAIDAEESKLILKALAEADWKGQVNFASLRPNMGQLFNRLGVTKADGFTPAVGANYQEAARAWVRDNAEKFRIQRNVENK
jgi:hypothetical protein